MRVIINCFAVSILCCGLGHAAEDVATTTLVFGSTIDKKCEAPPSLYTLESAQLAAWAASFGVKTVVGLATGLLEKASEAGTVTRSAVAPALLYDWCRRKRRKQMRMSGYGGRVEPVSDSGMASNEKMKCPPKRLWTMVAVLMGWMTSGGSLDLTASPSYMARSSSARA